MPNFYDIWLCAFEHYINNNYNIDCMRKTLCINNFATFSSYINKYKINLKLKLNTASFPYYYDIILWHFYSVLRLHISLWRFHWQGYIFFRECNNWLLNVSLCNNNELLLDLYIFLNFLDFNLIAGRNCISFY